MTLAHLSDTDMEIRTLMILRAAGRVGFLLHDAHEEKRIRAALSRSLLPNGFARVEGRGIRARAFITAKGFERSVAGEGA